MVSRSLNEIKISGCKEVARRAVARRDLRQKRAEGRTGCEDREEPDANCKDKDTDPEAATSLHGIF